MMKLDAGKFGLAAAATMGLVWLVCTVLVFLLPSMSMRASGYMMHGQFGGMEWQVSFIGVLAGLVLWSAIAGLTGWLLAWIYNRLTPEI